MTDWALRHTEPMFADVNVLLTKVSDKEKHLETVQQIKQQFAETYGSGQNKEEIQNAFQIVSDVVNEIKTTLNRFFVADTSSKALADWLIKYTSDQHDKVNGQPPPGKTLDSWVKSGMESLYSGLKEHYLQNPVRVRVRAFCVSVEVLWVYVKALTDNEVSLLVQEAYELLLPAHNYLTRPGQRPPPTTDEVKAITKTLSKIKREVNESEVLNNTSKKDIRKRLRDCNHALQSYIDASPQHSAQSPWLRTIPLVTVPKNRKPTESQKTPTSPPVPVRNIPYGGEGAEAFEDDKPRKRNTRTPQMRQLLDQLLHYCKITQ